VDIFGAVAAVVGLVMDPRDVVVQVVGCGQGDPAVATEVQAGSLAK